MVNPNRNWNDFETPETYLKKREEYQVNPIKKPTTQPTQNTQAPKQRDWGQYQTPDNYQGEPAQDDESTLGWLARNITSLGARAVEGRLGTPGNIKGFVEDVFDPKTEAENDIQRLVGKDQWSRIIRGNLPPGTMTGATLPTTSDLTRATNKLTGGYTSPRSKGEQTAQNIAQDVGTAARRGPTARQTAVNSLGIPIASNVAKEVVQGLGFDESKANQAKLATWLVLSLTGNINTNQYAANLTDQGRRGFDNSYRVSVPAYEQRLNQVSQGMFLNDPRSRLAQQQIAGIRDDIASGRTTMNDLMTRYDALNAAKRDAGLYALDAATRGAELRNINNVQSLVRREIENLGRGNPALRQWQEGMEAWSTIHRSNQISNFVRGVAQGPYGKAILAGPAASLFGGAIYGAYKNAYVSGGLGIGGGLALEGAKAAWRMGNSPALRRYYFDALNEAVRGNATGFLNNYNKLNEGLKADKP